jgi:hypothetical protein
MTRAPLVPIDQARAKAATDAIRKALEVSRRKPFVLGPSIGLIDVFTLLAHADPDVRATAAERLASLAPAVPQVQQAIPALENLLADEANVLAGVPGEFQCEGRLYHWRQERRSPRAAASRALFAVNYAADHRLVTAMLAEAAHAAIVCGNKAIPCRFGISQWRSAIDMAGGLTVCDPLIRTVQQRCQEQRWPGHNGPYVCASELAEVIHILSGRLIR